MRKVLILLIVLTSIGISAQEKAVLTTPIVTTSTRAEYEILSVAVQRKTLGYDWKIVIKYLDNLGNEYSDEHIGNDASDLVIALNKANLSVKSLERRALEHLISEGKITAASISGVPQ